MMTIHLQEQKHREAKMMIIHLEMDLERLEDREENKKQTKDKLKKMTALMTRLAMTKSHR